MTKRNTKELETDEKLPTTTDITSGRVKKTKRIEKYFIALPVKKRISVCTY